MQLGFRASAITASPNDPKVIAKAGQDLQNVDQTAKERRAKLQ